MKKTVLCLLAVAVGFVCITPSKVYADPPIPVSFVATITAFSDEIPVTRGNFTFIENIAVDASVTGGFTGNAQWIVSYRINNTTNKADLWGTVTLTVTSGPCVGTLKGTANGTSTFDPNTGSLYPDIGKLRLIGTNGSCKNNKINPDFEETDGVDGVFHFAGNLK